MKKISLPEAIFLVLGCIVFDGVDALITIFLLDLMGGGEFLKGALNVVFWATVGLYLKIKGVRQLWFATGSLLEFIPVVNALPIRTATILIVIMLDRSPRLTTVAATASPVASHLKK